MEQTEQTTMNRRVLGTFLVFLGLASAAFAQTSSVKILSPADGAKLDALDPIRIVYEVVRGPKADHIHLYVDGREAAILRGAKGSYTLETLSPGTREICIKAVNKAHVPTGVEQCIKVNVE
jgi:hypothetical protein